jgi:DNA-binding response OmpR family regulator
LMDCQMPTLSGYDAASAIRKQEASLAKAAIPIVALTAHAMDGDRERALASGMDDYIAKPLTLAKLQEVLDRWLATTTEARPQPIVTADVDGAPPALDPAVARSQRVLELTLRQLPSIADKLRAVAADPQQLKAEAHHFKGMCLSIGAMALARRFADIEKSPSQDQNWLTDVESELVVLRTAVEHELMANADKRAEAQ